MQIAIRLLPNHRLFKKMKRSVSGSNRGTLKKILSILIEYECLKFLYGTGATTRNEETNERFVVVEFYL